MSNPGPAVTTSAHPSNLSTSQAKRLLAVYKGLSVAAAADFNLQVNNSSSYSVQDILVTNSITASTGATVSVASVNLGVYTAPSKGGTAILTAAALSSNTASTVVYVTAPTTTAAQTAQNLYVNISTAYVAGATVDVYIYGYDFSASN
ncbi:hypothetical protein UFOVP42_46 [uncultured Caudovirales phage]|uniref:Uncharacterized protein n=1 Tax=uncultured Caudovirales phage TaxID=2100421 RepID=A0A6J5KR95_9CAUD|nr:hypothetical protein UFOVP42_46 [uncultured Caudovirales phage]